MHVTIWRDGPLPADGKTFDRWFAKPIEPYWRGLQEIPPRYLHRNPGTRPKPYARGPPPNKCFSPLRQLTPLQS